MSPFCLLLLEFRRILFPSGVPAPNPKCIITHQILEGGIECFSPAEVNFVCLLYKTMLNVESLVTQGDKFIIACCEFQLPPGPGSCMNKLPAALSLSALWRSHFRALLQAHSEESALAGMSQQWHITGEHLHRSFRWKNILFISQEGLGCGSRWVLCWITALKAQSNNVVRRKYSGKMNKELAGFVRWQLHCSKGGFFSGVHCQGQGGPCLFSEGKLAWIMSSCLTKADTECHVGNDKNVLLAKRYHRGQWNIASYFKIQ